MEWFLRIPSDVKDKSKRDWTITQKAWWDAILQIEAEPSVVRLTLEMRIMGTSQVYLAPQRGNPLGTTVIEVLTTLNTLPPAWAAFCQKLTNKWISYIDPTTGKRLHARPHWAKQWTFLRLPDSEGLHLKSFDWIRNVYKEEISLFMDALKKIGEEGGFTTDDLRMRFGNELMDSVLWHAPDPIVKLRKSDDVSRGVIDKIKRFFRKLFS
jgi:hypothetical protein